MVESPLALGSNYAFKPIAEQALRSNENVVPQRLNAALAFTGGRKGAPTTRGLRLGCEI